VNEWPERGRSCGFFREDHEHRDHDREDPTPVEIVDNLYEVMA
jgi:hypothetical protein